MSVQHKKTKAFTLLFLAFLIGLASPVYVNASTVVIVNPKSNIVSLDSKVVKKLFLGKMKNLPGGLRADLRYRPDDNSGHQTFLQKVLKKRPSQFKAYWSKRVFTGKDIKPKTVDSDKAARVFVASTQAGISYIDSSTVDSSVKVVLTVD